MKKLKRFSQWTYIMIVLTIFEYGLFSFSIYKLDPGKWHPDSRTFASFLWCFFAFMAIAYLSKDDDKGGNP